MIFKLLFLIVLLIPTNNASDLKTSINSFQGIASQQEHEIIENDECIHSSIQKKVRMLKERKQKFDKNDLEHYQDQFSRLKKENELLNEQVKNENKIFKNPFKTIEQDFGILPKGMESLKEKHPQFLAVLGQADKILENQNEKSQSIAKNSDQEKEIKILNDFNDFLVYKQSETEEQKEYLQQNVEFLQKHKKHLQDRINEFEQQQRKYMKSHLSLNDRIDFFKQIHKNLENDKELIKKQTDAINSRRQNQKEQFQGRNTESLFQEDVKFLKQQEKWVQEDEKYQQDRKNQYERDNKKLREEMNVLLKKEKNFRVDSLEQTNTKFNDCDSNWGHQTYTCNQWLQSGYCTSTGLYGAHWNFVWGTFANYQDERGNTAFVCPQCGCSQPKMCTDIKIVLQDWYDSKGIENTCGAYTEKMCKTIGHQNKNFGYTANEACCVCGGGNKAANHTNKDD